VKQWLLTLILLLLPTGAAWSEAWGDACNACPPNARWRAGAAPTFEVPIGVLSGSLVYDLRDASRAWQEGPCAAPGFSAAAVEETRFERDGVNAVVFAAFAPEAGDAESVVAATCNRCDAEGFIVESDIEIFGPAALWNDNCLSASFSQRGVLLHELGHTLGLDDGFLDGGGVMFGVVSASQSQRFGSPAATDFAALCGLYGVKADAALFTPVSQSCVDSFGRVGAPCDGEGPTPAGLLCVSLEDGARWAARCDGWQACEPGSTCVALGEEGEEVGFCAPDAPLVTATVGAPCSQDAECPEGLCGAEPGEAGRCLQQCGPSLSCGGSCSDVVKAGVYRGRWCKLASSQAPASRIQPGCTTSSSVGWPSALLFGLLLLARRRHRAIRLATRCGAP
jgi:hypothetical protein